MKVENVIYQIKNQENGKRYIGSTKNKEKRWREHKWHLRHNSHCNSYLQRSWNKYGNVNFEFSVIDEVENEEDLLSREQFYIDTEDPEYNITPKANRTKLSEETKKKISKTRLGKDNPMYGKKGKENPMYGKHHPTEVREKISKNHADVSGKNNPMYGKTRYYTKETREKMSIANQGEDNPNAKLTKKKVKIIKHLLKGDRFCCRQIATMFGVSRVSINNIFNGKTWNHITIKE